MKRPAWSYQPLGAFELLHLLLHGPRDRCMAGGNSSPLLPKKIGRSAGLDHVVPLLLSPNEIHRACLFTRDKLVLRCEPGNRRICGSSLHCDFLHLF